MWVLISILFARIVYNDPSNLKPLCYDIGNTDKYIKIFVPAETHFDFDYLEMNIEQVEGSEKKNQKIYLVRRGRTYCDYKLTFGKFVRGSENKAIINIWLDVVGVDYALDSMTFILHKNHQIGELSLAGLKEGISMQVQITSSPTQFSASMKNEFSASLPLRSPDIRHCVKGWKYGYGNIGELRLMDPNFVVQRYGVIRFAIRRIKNLMSIDVYDEPVFIFPCNNPEAKVYPIAYVNNSDDPMILKVTFRIPGFTSYEGLDHLKSFQTDHTEYPRELVERKTIMTKVKDLNVIKNSADYKKTVVLSGGVKDFSECVINSERAVLLYEKPPIAKTDIVYSEYFKRDSKEGILIKSKMGQYEINFCKYRITTTMAQHFERY